MYGVESGGDLVNVIVSGNLAGDDGGGIEGTGTPGFSYSDVWGNFPDNFYGIADFTGIDGNLSLDPEFNDISDADPLDWDLHVGQNSPLIDQGSPSIDDPDGGDSDIGAYGGPDADSWDLDLDGYPEWWLPGPYDYVTYPAMSLDCDDKDDTVYPGVGC